MKTTTACIIVNYNDSQRTITLLNHIKEFSSMDYLIVVDNCSSDNSFEILSKFNHSKYHLLKSPCNGGYGFGNNYGAKHAKELGADFILIANPDVWFDDFCVKHIKKTINDNPSCAIVSAKETKIGTYGWRYTTTIHDILSASLFFNKLLKKRYYPKEYFLNKNNVEVDIIPGCFLLVDLSKFLEVGGYDEECFLYEEEKILYSRIKKQYKSIVDLEVEYKHNHVESHSYSLKSVLIGKKRLINSRLFFLKKYRKANLLTIIFAHFFLRLSLVEMFFYFFIKKVL